MANSKFSTAGHILIALILIAGLAFAIEFVMRIVPPLHTAELAVDDRAFSWAADKLASQHTKLALVVFVDEAGAVGQGESRATDRGQLAKLITEIDAAGARAIGLDVLFLQPTNSTDDDALVEAIRTSRAVVVPGAADERVSLKPAEIEYQNAFLARAGRKAGYVNLRTEGDGVVRYMASPNAGGKWPSSFANMLAGDSAPAASGQTPRRIAWLAPPWDGSETFLTLPASVLLSPANDMMRNVVRNILNDRVVVIGRVSVFQDVGRNFQDKHRTPLSNNALDLTPGVTVQGQMTAQYLDMRTLTELSPLGRTVAIALAAILGYWVGFRFRISNSSCFLNTLALGALIGMHFIAFSQFRLFIPATAMLFGFIGALFVGDYMGRALDRRWLQWLGLHPTRRASAA